MGRAVPPPGRAAEVLQGANGPRARYGALQADLQRLRGLLLGANEGT